MEIKYKITPQKKKGEDNENKDYDKQGQTVHTAQIVDSQEQ